MYFNPAWSHAHSAFVCALFLWYWDQTREHRALGEWLLLGLIVGLMLDVYYPNLMIVTVLAQLDRNLPSLLVAPMRGGLLLVGNKG